MNTFVTWQDAIASSLQGLWIKFINFIPQVLAALVVLIIGLLVASALGTVAKKLIEYLKVDSFLEKYGVKEQLERFGMNFTFAELIGWIIKWFLIIAVWIAVLQVLNLDQVGNLLEKLVLFLPNVITAVIILAIGFVGGQFMYQVVDKAVTASTISNAAAGTLAALAKWSIIVFAFLAAMTQLGIATRLVEILFTGFVAMIALAGGLAFGLGGRDKAGEWLEAMQRETRVNTKR